MELKKKITVNHKFRGVHNWQFCPFNSVQFLKSPHHHQFEVTLSLYVTDDDREFEFIKLQHLLECFICNIYPNYNEEHKENTGDEFLRVLYSIFPTNKHVPYTADLGSKSCEMIANDILTCFKKVCNNDIEVSVSEDGHYAGTIIYKQ